MKPETKLKVRCVEYLKKKQAEGVRLWFYCPSDIVRRAIPDLIMSINALSVVCELKDKGEKPNPRQKKELRDIRKSGALAFWCDDFKDFINIIETFIAFVRDGEAKKLIEFFEKNLINHLVFGKKLSDKKFFDLM